MFQSVTSAVYFVFILILSVSGTFGNVCALIAVVKSPTLRKRNNLFMVSMTCADLLVTIVIEPLMLVQLYYEAWPFSYASCKFFPYVFVYSMGNATMTVSFLTMQRYFKITQSAARYDKMFGKYKAEFHLVNIWIGGIFLSIVPEFGYGSISFNPLFLMCVMDPDDFDSWLHLTILMGAALFFLLPVPFQYYQIFCMVRGARLRVKHHAQERTIASQPTTNPSLSKEELRLTKISLLVTFMVMVTWLPTCISHFLLRAVPSALVVFRHCQMILLINSSLNPYLYAWMNKHYRTALTDILGICIKKNHLSSLSNNITSLHNHVRERETGLTPPGD